MAQALTPPHPRHHLIASIKKHWDAFKGRKPGSRFQDTYRARAKKSGGKPTKKILFMVAGIALSAVGIFLLAVPGPGLLVLAVGLMFVAGESMTMARFLDWLEVELRKLIAWGLRLWRRSSPMQRAALVGLVVLLLGGAAAGMLYLFFFR